MICMVNGRDNFKSASRRLLCKNLRFEERCKLHSVQSKDTHIHRRQITYVMQNANHVCVHMFKKQSHMYAHHIERGRDKLSMCRQKHVDTGT